MVLVLLREERAEGKEARGRVEVGIDGDGD